MKELSLHVKRWSAWVPGINRCNTWDCWTPELAEQYDADKPKLQSISPMQRRRLTGVGRIAVEVATDCLQGFTVDSGVFCSRHGECARTLNIFSSVAASREVSPTQFSQSVHNAAAGVFSIDRELDIPFTALSAGQATAELGFVEAYAQLASGYQSVLLVMADERLQAPFSDFSLTPRFSFGVALLLGHFPDCPSLHLRQNPPSSELSGGTDNLLALLTGSKALHLEGNNGWSWDWDGH